MEKTMSSNHSLSDELLTPLAKEAQKFTYQTKKPLPAMTRMIF